MSHSFENGGSIPMQPRDQIIAALFLLTPFVWCWVKLRLVNRRQRLCEPVKVPVRRDEGTR